MGSRVTFSNTDILSSKLVKPGWYPFRVNSYSEEAASTDGSALHVFKLAISDGEYKDVPLRFQISEKWMGGGVDFVGTCLGADPQPGVSVDFESLVGKTGEVCVQRGEYKNKPQNEVVGFRPAK